jgi:MFS family permease
VLKRLKETYLRFSPKFWILVLAAFIDRLGGTIIFPFFSLYITQRFEVGMAQAGLLLGSFSLFGFIGNILGGALTDRFGRKGMILFGLSFSAISSVAFGLVDQFYLFFILAIFVGLLSDIGGPAYQAMVADLLPEENRAEGYGIIRIAVNLSWIIGPMLGGLLAVYSYLLLFVLDAISSLIVAAIVFRFIPETKPKADPTLEQEPLLKTFAGYIEVARDKLFLAFVVAMIFNVYAYGQIYNTLSVFLRDVHGVPERGYGLLMSANAGMVVLLQFWITSRLRGRPPMLVLALGTVFYLVGLTMYGYVAVYGLFLLAMLLITIGEMIILPTAQALAAKFAPEQLRGRYMAFFSISWMIPSMFGPGLSGLVLDSPYPRLLWYICGLSCLVAITAFLRLHNLAGDKVNLVEQPG